MDAVQDAAESEGLRMRAALVICQIMGEFKTEVMIPVAEDGSEGMGRSVVDVAASPMDE